MNKYEQSIGIEGKPHEESPEERIQKIEGLISKKAVEGNFDEVLKLSLERAEILKNEEKRVQEKAMSEALPSRLREHIKGMKERITGIEDGSFPIDDPDPSLKPNILEDIKKQLAIIEEDLLIAEGSVPSYEAQSEQLEKELEEITERYARRWEELVQSGEESRIFAFIGNSRKEAFEYPGMSPYESAKLHVKADLAQHMNIAMRPRNVRDSLLHVKRKLEESLRHSDETSEVQ